MSRVSNEAVKKARRDLVNREIMCLLMITFASRSTRYLLYGWQPGSEGAVLVLINLIAREIPVSTEAS